MRIWCCTNIEGPNLCHLDFLRNSVGRHKAGSQYTLRSLLPAPIASIQAWVGILVCKKSEQIFSCRYRLFQQLFLVVHESMMESRLNNIVPAQLLRLWINQEKDLVRELVALGEMVSSPWQQRLLQLFERHFRRIGDYTQVKRLSHLIYKYSI